VIHIGPIAATARDAALTYLLLSKPSPTHFYSTEYGGALSDDTGSGRKSLSIPPPAHLHRFNDIDSLADLRVGVFWDYFNDASPEVVEQATKAINTLKKLGATIKNISIPHLRVLSMAHGVTVSTEMSAILENYYVAKNSSLELPTAIQLGIGYSMSAVDYVAAGRIRGWALNYFQKAIFSDVDIFATPTAPFTAPEIPPEILEENFSHTSLVMKLMKFIFLSNIVGFPSMSVPIAHDSGSMPIGLCINAAHWNDAVLLRVAHALEVHHLKRVAPKL